VRDNKNQLVKRAREEERGKIKYNSGGGGSYIILGRGRISISKGNCEYILLPFLLGSKNATHNLSRKKKIILTKGGLLPTPKTPKKTPLPSAHNRKHVSHYNEKRKRRRGLGPVRKRPNPGQSNPSNFAKKREEERSVLPPKEKIPHVGGFKWGPPDVGKQQNSIS